MSIIPSQIQAGDTLELEYSNANYPASTWAITGYLRGQSIADISFIADGDNHTATVTAATTALWTAGVYQYSIVAAKGAEKVTIETGYASVLSAISSIFSPASNASHVKKVLDAIEATIEGSASSDQLRVKINNRELEKMSLLDLYRFRQMYKAEYAQELRANGLATGLQSGNQVRVRL